MKCKCSLNNNYEVIGLCDIEKFNAKISKFSDKTWTQITIPEKLILPDNKPSIKEITKVFLDLKITSTKIIKTPSSNDSPSIEGLKLTGKVLLVSGNICQTIIYSAETIYTTMHSVKFNVPFNTYIVIDENADLENDSYCVYPCVEDVTVRPLDKRTLSKSVTLFLFAHKISPIVPPIQDIPNIFIFNTSDTDEEMGRVAFNSSDKKLIVTSTGKIYNQPLATATNVFVFALNNLTTANFTRSSITGMEDLSNFVNELNDLPFDYDTYAITLSFRDNPKIKLTNYPNQGDTYSMIGKNLQSFKITQTGIIPYIFEQKIILNGANNQPVAIIQFDVLTREILVTSTGNLTSRGGQNYFKMTLFQSDGTTIVATSTIPGNSNGNTFKTAFNSESFGFQNMIIKLEYEDRTKVVVTNFEGTPTYNPGRTEELFRIAQYELKRFTQPPIVISPNVLVFKTKNTNEEMARIKFDKTNMKLIVSSTGKSYNEPLSPNSFIPNANAIAFNFELKDLNGTSKISAQIMDDGNADSFRDRLNDFSFSLTDKIELLSENEDRLILTNYPTQGQNYSIISDVTQSFKTSIDRVFPNILPNTITLNSKSNIPVIVIKFDILNKIFLVKSTGKPIGSPTVINYFVMTQYKSDGTTAKQTRHLHGNEGGTIFKAAFNALSFEWDDVIELEYKENDKVIITNYPNQGDPIYNPKTNDSERFIITPTGLKEG